MKRTERIAKNKVIYIDDHIQAPKSARFILRKNVNHSDVRLEEYSDNKYSFMRIVHIFPHDSLEVSNIGETIRECQKLIGGSVLYLERPNWMHK